MDVDIHTTICNLHLLEDRHEFVIYLPTNFMANSNHNTMFPILDKYPQDTTMLVSGLIDAKKLAHKENMDMGM